jgi:predicted RNase H-like HicB family nuclease
MMRQVIIYPGEDGYWVAECPSLPGCISQGATKEEAVANIREAIKLYIAALNEDRLPVPEERFETLVIAVSRRPRVSGRECVSALAKVGC